MLAAAAAGCGGGVRGAQPVPQRDARGGCHAGPGHHAGRQRGHRAAHRPGAACPGPGRRRARRRAPRHGQGYRVSPIVQCKRGSTAMTWSCSPWSWPPPCTKSGTQARRWQPARACAPSRVTDYIILCGDRKGYPEGKGQAGGLPLCPCPGFLESPGARSSGLKMRSAQQHYQEHVLFQHIVLTWCLHAHRGVQ